MTSPAKPFHFEAALKELEEITQWFEGPNVDLDKGLAKFERGLELAQSLKSHLETVDNKVETIKQRFAAETKSQAAASGKDLTADDEAGQTDIFDL